MDTPRRSLVFLVALAGIASLAIYAVVNSVPSAATPPATLLTEEFTEEFTNEFSGAYQEEVEQTGTLVEVEVRAQEGQVEIFEGYPTAVWSYNGAVPAPEIRIRLGDTLRINFINNLPQHSTIHFHGIRVPNAMDGVPDITQPTVEPDSSFTYEFTPKDAGTFWFHPHHNSSEQVERGLYGAIVVEDEYAGQYSQDRVWIIDDWLLENYQLYPHFVTPHDLAHDGRWGNVITVNSSVEEVLVAQPGQRIRLRLINASNGRVYNLAFGTLMAQAIAVDGMYAREPFNAEGFNLAPGNRLDVDITIPADAAGLFAIQDLFTGRAIPLGTIHVQGAVVATPDFAYPTNPRVPLWKGAEEIPASQEYVLSAGESAQGGIAWLMNGTAFPRYTPVELTHGQFNILRLVNSSPRLHPMHLHGQFFKVITRNGAPVEEPYFRDTVLLGPHETLQIGLVPLDKGRWVNHCHILEHADAGMMTVVSVR